MAQLWNLAQHPPGPATGRLRLCKRTTMRIFDANICAMRDRNPDYAEMILSVKSSDPPRAEFARLNDATKARLRYGGVAVVIGLGTGEFVRAFEQQDLGFINGQMACLWVVDPCPLSVRRAFESCNLVDAIRSKRIQWVLGSAWAEVFARAIAPPCWLPAPVMAIFPGETQQDIMAEILAIYDVHKKAIDLVDASNRAYYDALDITRWPSGYGRPPRVMFITSKFTTVLQYVTKDVSEAFERMGWGTKILIEGAPYQHLNYGVIVHAVNDFKPDLVWILDHLKEVRAGFPANVPHVTWIQDSLFNLFAPGEAKKMGARDFALTFLKSMFVDVFGYPEQKLLDFPMFMSKPRTRCQAPVLRREADLVYISHVSETPEVAIERLANSASPGLRDFAIRCMREVVNFYARGGVIYNRCKGLTSLIDTIELGHTMRAKHIIAECFLAPIHGVLHRQQALRWIARAAERLGLSLAIYGNGWERNTEFAKFAKGPIKYGEVREDIMAKAKINFVLEPYPSILHQRLLDTVSVGGFALQRYLPLTEMTQALLNRLPPGVQTLNDLPSELKQWAQEMAPHIWRTDDDVVTYVRSVEKMGAFKVGEAEALPHLWRTSFASEEECFERIQEFVDDASERERVSRDQFAGLDGRMDYRVGLERVIAFVRKGLNE